MGAEQFKRLPCVKGAAEQSEAEELCAGTCKKSASFRMRIFICKN